MLALLFFSLAIISKQLVFSVEIYAIAVTQLPDVLRWLEQPVRWIIIVGAGLWVVHRQPVSWMVRELGLIGNVTQGLWLAFVACSPMLVVPMLLGNFSASEIGPRLIFSALI